MMKVLSSGVVALSFSMVRNALMISRSHPSRASPRAVSLSSQAWSTSGWCTSHWNTMTTMSTTAHVNGKSWTEWDWSNLNYLRIFAQTRQYFCNKTSVFLQYLFTFHLHWASVWGLTERFWCKSVSSQTWGPNWPPLVKKRDVRDTGPQLTF